MKRLFPILLIISVSTSVSYSRSSSSIDSLVFQGKRQIQQAVNAWNLQKMLAARAFFERLLADKNYPWLIHYYIGLADLHIFHYYFPKSDKENAENFVDDGIGHLEKALELKDDFAEGYALLSSLLGNKIALNPDLGMTLGMKSGTMIQKAFGRAPENPRVSLIAGESAYYTPKMFGGGKEKALRHIRKAIECFEKFRREKDILPTWGYDEAYAYLGLIQMDQGNLMEARKNFGKALKINPDYSWVKFKLLPELEKRMAKK